MFTFVFCSVYDDALTELVSHYANGTLIVSCTKDCTLTYGEGLRAVDDVLSLLLTVLRR